MDWTAAVLGIIEGITEFVPISSTGHLLIAEHWLGPRSDTFNVVIQAGAMLAVTMIYRRRLATLAMGWRRRENRLYLGRLAIAFAITVVLGWVVKKLGVGLPENVAPVAWALVVGGLWMMVAEWFASGREDRADVTWIAAVMVGIAQIVAAVFPGTSRSGATIFAAMFAGTSNRSAATDFAFLVGIPTMYAASAYQLLGDFQNGGVNDDWIALTTAFVTSFVTAFAAVKWLLEYIQSHRFTAFAIYRIVLGTALIVLPS
jgi:undecaprenyl-diphosphatase